ncbi:hypothetical protein HD806DRAFT_497274 [Xylariaceae sp. AK1471]|nr:hypothetical protein HD806DRAFT_497274 [Xylariaceae sp. AK1471]
MKFTISSVVLAVLAGLANAKVMLTNSAFDGIEAGKTFEITWADAQGPVTLTLKNGPEGNLKTVSTITTNASGKSFEWPVDPALPTGKYAIEISDGTDSNYSGMFDVEGGAVSTSSTASPSSSSSFTVSTSTSSTASSTSTSESSSTESSTSSESSTTSSESTTTTATTTVNSSSTTSSRPTRTTSDAPETSVPNNNNAHSMAAPFVPGILAALGAALL